MTIEFVCKYCGKTEIMHEKDPRARNVFCNRACYVAYHERKRKRTEELKRLRKTSVPRVPQSKCSKCNWSVTAHHQVMCCYFEKADHSRLSLHPSGLTNDCEEFSPKRRRESGYS